jgi:hypothetical protein
MASDFQILPTPSQEEFMFAIRVPDTKIRQNLFIAAGITLTSAVTANTLGTDPTTYAQFAWAVNKQKIQTDTAFYNYVYLKCDKSDADHMNFYFGKAKTPDQRNTPFQQFWDTRQYTWPAVLLDLYLVKSNIPQFFNTGTSVETAPRVIPRYHYRPGVAYNSTVLVRQYLAEVPWSDSDLTHPQPVPTDVNGSYIGAPAINFPRCLHPAIRFPELTPGALVISGAGVINPPIGRNPMNQLFPATNFLDWAPFFIEDRQQPVNGLFLRELIEIFPPPPPKKVIT